MQWTKPWGKTQKYFRIKASKSKQLKFNEVHNASALPSSLSFLSLDLQGAALDLLLCIFLPDKGFLGVQFSSDLFISGMFCIDKTSLLLQPMISKRADVLKWLFGSVSRGFSSWSIMLLPRLFFQQLSTKSAVNVHIENNYLLYRNWASSCCWCSYTLSHTMKHTTNIHGGVSGCDHIHSHLHK